MSTARPRALLVITADDTLKSHTSGPRKDYRALVEALDADTIDRTTVRFTPVLAWLVRYVGMATAQAWLAFRERAHYDVIVTDGEHIAIPLALLLKMTGSKVAHVTIGHRVTASKKKPFFKWLKVHSHIDKILLHSRRQYELAIRELGIPADRLALIPYQVDTGFWQPLTGVDEQCLICSAGLEFRDYPTLFRAVEGLEVEVVIGAASNWSKRRNTAADEPLPRNVRVSAFDYESLRQVYARSAVVVVPLDDIDFQAGITTILEAMSMGKPVVVTHSRGQTDVVEDRRSATRGAELRWRPTSLLRELAQSEAIPVKPTGFYVPPHDARALRRALAYLLDHPEERRRLGDAGRETVERLVTVDQFAARVREIVRGVCRTGSPAPLAPQLPFAAQHN